MKIKENNFYELNNGDFCVINIIGFNNKGTIVKYRVVKSCKGKHSRKSRIGKPYTYQLISKIHNFKKRIKRQVSKEEILNLLFKQQKDIYTHKTIKPIYLDCFKPVGKPKVTLFKFNAEEIKKGDITRFRNLLIKLKVEGETIEMPTNLKGRKANVVTIDEAVELKDVKGIWKKLKEMGIWKKK